MHAGLNAGVRLSLTVLDARAGAVWALLDLDHIESLDDVELSVCEAEKHPLNPLMPLGDVHEWDALQARPWHGRTVLFDEADQLFKCWYDGTDLSTERWWATGYAESDDGLHWVKPNLGLHAYRGNTDNNICLLGWGPVAIDDADPDPNRRFKMIEMTKPFTTDVVQTSREPAIRLACSPDGRHWTEGPPFAIEAWGDRQPDVSSLRIDADDAPERRVKIVWQGRVPSKKPGPAVVRSQHISFGPDFETPLITATDAALDPGDGSEHEIHFAMLGRSGEHFVLPFEHGIYSPDGTGVHGRYVADVRLAAARSLGAFTRVSRDRPLIARGPRGTWDDGFLVITSNPIERNGAVYLYYAGCGEDWTSWMGANQQPAYRWESTGSVRRSQMGVATLPRNRYSAVQTLDRETPGMLVTRPIRPATRGLDLWANVSAVASRRSWVDVEVLHPERDEALPGFAVDESVPLERDSIRTRVRWRGIALSDLSAEAFRLRFRLVGAARLHAFGFDPAVDQA